jgi:MFS family permease
MDRQLIGRRNYQVVVIEGFFLFSAFAFLGVNSVVPVFIHEYTQSLKLAGLANTLKIACAMIGQIVVGPHVHKIRSIPRFNRRLFFLARPAPILIVIFLMAGSSPYLTVWVFLILFSILWFADGVTTVPSLDLVGRTIDDRKRGRMFGYYQLTGGIGTLAAGFVIKMTMGNATLNSSVKYSIIFGFSGALLLLTALVYLPVRDLPREKAASSPKFLEYFARMPGHFRANKLFSTMIGARIVNAFAGMVYPFVILYCSTTFDLVSSEVSTLIYLQMAGTLLGGIVWGNISHRFGNKYVIIISQITALAVSVLVILSHTFSSLSTPYTLLWGMCLLTGISVAAWIGYLNYTIDIADAGTRSTYLVMSSIITLPLAFLSFLSGLIADRIGLLPLFYIGAAASCIALLISFRLKTPARLIKKDGTPVAR